jgi:hypothetical protein
MITYYDENVKHLHLFTDHNEIQLSKLDILYANTSNDFNEGLLGSNLL